MKLFKLESGKNVYGLQITYHSTAMPSGDVSEYKTAVIIPDPITRTFRLHFYADDGGVCNDCFIRWYGRREYLGLLRFLRECDSIDPQEMRVVEEIVNMFSIANE